MDVCINWKVNEHVSGCIFLRGILINIWMILDFFQLYSPPRKDVSVLPRYQISATRPCCGGRSNPSSRAPTKSWTGDQGGMKTEAATLLPQTWAKGAKGAQVLLLQNQVESGFEMVSILENRCGNFCSALSHAFVIQKVECGSTPMLALASRIHQPKWDLSYRCLTRTRKRGIWVFLCMQKWRRKPLQVLKIIGPSCSAFGPFSWRG